MLKKPSAIVLIQIVTVLCCGRFCNGASFGHNKTGETLVSASTVSVLKTTGFYPVDEDGLFVAKREGGEAPESLQFSGPVDPAGLVRCKLVDHVDCSIKDHEFTDDGTSRVWEYGGKKWRLTADTLKLSFFSYRLHTNAKPGRPHLIVAELLNDRERYTTITITAPKNFSWAPPYRGEEKFHPDNQESDGVRQDVGCCVYSGREFPVDGKPFLHSFLFWPKSGKIIVTITHRENEETKLDSFDGGCVHAIWIYELIDRLPPLKASNERKIGLYVPHPWYLYGHYGVPARTREQRTRSLSAFVEYMKFLGLNTLQFHVINGSDTASRAWYPGSKYYPFLCGDLLSELLPLCEKNNIEVVPIIAPLINPHVQHLSRHPELCGQYFRSGKGRAKGLRSGSPDPLRPETKKLLLDCLEEIARRCASFKCVTAVGFRINGKIGICYAGDTDKKRAQWYGYSPWDLKEFQKDTGIDLPSDREMAFSFLKEHAWDSWISWRCKRTMDLYIAARDRLRSIRSDFKLLLSCDLPSEVPAMNIEWGTGEPVRQLLRFHGYDPELLANVEGIWSSRSHLVNLDRFFNKWAPPHSTNAWAYKAFQYNEGLANCFFPANYRTVEIYHNYWEESPHPENEFGPYLRTANAAPLRYHFLEPVPYVLRVENCARLLFMGWQRASINGEVLLRRLAKVWRSIPLGPVRPFNGWIKRLSGGRRSAYHGGFAWARYYGKKLVAVNETAEKVEILLEEYKGSSYRLTLEPWEIKIAGRKR